MLTRLRRLLVVLVIAVPVAHGAAQQTHAGGESIPAVKQEIRNGDLDHALATLQRLQQEHDAPLAALLDLRGCIEMEQKKFDAAAASFQAAHEAQPALFAPRLHAGDLLLREQKWEEARAVYEQLMKETNVLTSNERLRYAVLITFLGARDEAAAQTALQRITFPTETPAYYYAQAAAAFATANRRGAEKWITTAGDIFPRGDTEWFARPLFDLGWLKTKPPLTTD